MYHLGDGQNESARRNSGTMNYNEEQNGYSEDSETVTEVRWILERNLSAEANCYPPGLFHGWGSSRPRASHSPECYGS